MGYEGDQFVDADVGDLGAGRGYGVDGAAFAHLVERGEEFLAGAGEFLG